MTIGDSPGPRPSRDRRILLVYGALVLVQIFFGIQYLAAKLVLAQLAPKALAVLRIGGASLLLAAVVRLSGRSFPRDGGTIARLALYAVFGVGLNQLLFVEGLSRTTPTHSSLINATIPVATLLLAVVAGRERLARRKLASIAVAVGGVLLLIGPAALGSLRSIVTGDLLTLANALSFSLFLVLSKPLLGRTDPLGATALLMLFGALMIGAVGLPSLLDADLRGLSTTNWILLGYIVVFPTAGAYLLQYWALARVDSSVVAFFIYLQPVIATGLSVAVLGERLTVTVFAGASLIFVGVYLALNRRTASARAA